MPKIEASVGKDKPNRRDDVKTIQRLVNLNIRTIPPTRPLQENGAPSDHLWYAIFAFQDRVMRLKKPDGWVSSTGNTLKEFNRRAAAAFKSSWINFRGHKISDIDVLIALDRIGRELKGKIWVTSGDRGHVPKGGAKDSLHLQHMAADFGVVGYSLEDAFAKIKEGKSRIFDSSKRYEFIHHGEFTKTGGKHLHLGVFPSGKGLKILVEGLTKDKRGKYELSP